MTDLNRRSALALGLTAVAATPVLSFGAAAATYSADEGEEMHPGVRVIMLGKRESMIPATKIFSCQTRFSSPARRGQMKPCRMTWSAR